MSKRIDLEKYQDLWIMTESGLVLYHKSIHQLDKHLFGGFMSALHSFSQEIDKGGITNFMINERRYSIYKKQNLIFVIGSYPTVKEKRVLMGLEAISEQFIELYGSLLENWDGEVTPFKNFGDILQSQYNGNVENFLLQL